MSADDLALRSATELSALVSKGELSPVELTQAFIDRAQRFERLNAYITLDANGYNGSGSATFILSVAQVTTSILGGTVFVDYQNPFITQLFAVVGGQGSTSVTAPSSASAVLRGVLASSFTPRMSSFRSWKMEL